MVGADIGARDCYGNTPSQIFDDHVTEPVLDEVRRSGVFALHLPSICFIPRKMIILVSI